MRATLTASLLLATLAAPVLADETTGVILAYDRVDGIIVLDDKTVWELGADLEVPADLKAGDTVHLVYATAGEDGMIGIDALTRE